MHQSSLPRLADLEGQRDLLADQEGQAGEEVLKAATVSQHLCNNRSGGNLSGVPVPLPGGAATLGGGPGGPGGRGGGPGGPGGPLGGPSGPLGGPGGPIQETLANALEEEAKRKDTLTHVDGRRRGRRRASWWTCASRD